MAADIYKESPSGGTLSRSEAFRASERYEMGLLQGTSPDLVRWGPVLAGVFSTLSATALLSVFGLAIGFSSIDPNDTLRSFGIGAGVWGAATALISFFVGGWVSGRTTSSADTFTRTLQGAMVWVVTIPVLLYVAAGGAGSLLRTLGEVEHTAQLASRAAWGAFLSMLLGLVAAGIGGYVASRRQLVEEVPVSTTGPSQQPYH